MFEGPPVQLQTAPAARTGTGTLAESLSVSQYDTITLGCFFSLQLYNFSHHFGEMNEPIAFQYCQLPGAVAHTSIDDANIIYHHGTAIVIVIGFLL